jgi:hypothetical protein
MFNRIAIALALLSLAACAAPRPRPVTRQLPAQAALQSLPAAGEYPIDSSGSELRLLVYRGGSLANLGHNHVMVSRTISGFVHIGTAVPASSFSLRVRADSFVVDDAQARQEEGGDFSGVIPQDAKASTRRNMLSAAVLNAAEYPDITLKSASLSGSLNQMYADVEISVAGHSSRLSVPLTLQGDAHRFIAAGSMEMRQTAMGLTPYSLLHGALQVQDAIQLQFKITVSTN